MKRPEHKHSGQKRSGQKHSGCNLQDRLAKLASAEAPAPLGVSEFAASRCEDAGRSVSRRRAPRPAPRRAVFKPARIVYGEGGAAACIVSNLSEGGARIAIEREDAFPHRVMLHVGFATPPRRARIVWRGKGEYGLTFLDDGTATAHP